MKSLFFFTVKILVMVWLETTLHYVMKYIKFWKVDKSQWKIFPKRLRPNDSWVKYPNRFLEFNGTQQCTAWYSSRMHSTAHLQESAACQKYYFQLHEKVIEVIFPCSIVNLCEVKFQMAAGQHGRGCSAECIKKPMVLRCQRDLNNSKAIHFSNSAYWTFQ